MKTIYFLIFCFCCFGVSIVHAQFQDRGSSDLTSFVDPFIGTGGHGHTFPGATLPFGMVQLSPDTRLEGWDGCSGYHFTDSIVYGFSHTHLSGTGVEDYCDLLIMPTVGEIMLDNGYKSGHKKGYASAFDKASEVASPGYYSVKLKDYGIDVELTCTERSGMHHYTYPEEGEMNFIIDLLHRDKLLSGNLYLDKISEKEISGHRFSQSWAQNQKLFFVIQFSRVIELKDKLHDEQGQMVKAGFRLKGQERELMIKVGLSAVSIENARENLASENSAWDFNKTKNKAVAAWQNELSKIEVEGGTNEQRIIFYTALYHTMIAPNTWSDVNGEYRGMDDRIHKLHKGDKAYTIFSLWDTFRAAHPLFTLIHQERTNEFIRTFLRQYQQSGRLPVWELAANETDCMIGYHSVSVAMDAWSKGLRGWDGKLMLEAMTQSAGMDHFGLESYRSNGCIMAGDEAESVSKTLEYAYDDWCIAQMAWEMGDKTTYQRFIRRAQSYKNLYDPQSRFFRARMDGGWFGPFDPSEVNFNYTEANAWQYSLFVPQDVKGLENLLGGPEKLEKRLDNLFSVSSETTGRHQSDITGLIGQYAHGNEPSHHMAYLYNYLGKPWKTAERISEIMNELYTTRPDGLSGNEDCGQMSAWYVLSGMGFYQLTPGVPIYTFGTSIFDKVTINLENGNTFTILANPGKGPYIHSAQLNGQPYSKSYLEHDAIVQGGSLKFDLSNVSKSDWGTAKGDYPHQSIQDYPIIPVPFFGTDKNTFLESIVINMGSLCMDCKLYYSIDDAEPMVYTEPFEINQSASISIWSESREGDRSRTISQDFFKIDGTRTLTLNCQYPNQYSAGGNNALIDHQRGNANYRTGRWQGYQGQNFEAFLDLGKLVNVNKVKIGFLQDVKSWIFYPPQVEFSYSTDGSKYHALPVQKNDFPDDREGSFIQDFEVDLSKAIRYVKIIAPNYGPAPSWHAGAGGMTWLFADEIVIE